MTRYNDIIKRYMASGEYVPQIHGDLLKLLNGYVDLDKLTLDLIKWDIDHPSKTMLQDVLEKLPNLKLQQDGTPAFCPGDIGYSEPENCVGRCIECIDCWNRPVEM